MLGVAGTMAATVRGARPTADLGILLPHEHIVIDTTPHQPASDARAPRLLLDYTTEDSVVSALQRFKRAGGGGLIECTPAGCGRNPIKLREIADRLDLHIICATGWYRQENHPSNILALSASGRAEIMMKELANGIDDTGIRPGIIKVGTSVRITPHEETTLRAAARAQAATGIGFAIHISNIEHAGGDTRHVEMPSAHRVLDIIESEGADLSKVCLCHADGTYINSTTAVRLHLSLLSRGIFLSYDQFALNPIPEAGIAGRPADDAERIRALISILESDHEHLNRILLSQDVSSHEQLAAARGGAYSHLLTTVRSQLENAGLSQVDVLTIIRDNPARFVALDKLPTYDHRDPAIDFGGCAWYWHRAVRTTDDTEGLFYTPDDQAVLEDEAMCALDPEGVARFLEMQLAILLHFTAWLEMNPVLEVCRAIFENLYAHRFQLPSRLRDDALKILSDEVSHTDICSEFLAHLDQGLTSAASGIVRIAGRRLGALVANTPVEYRDIGTLAYVLVSEITITAALEVAPRDERVRMQVREILRDHAEDERRHQAYFRDILAALWSALSVTDRTGFAEVLVRAMETFLIPDSDTVRLAVSAVLPLQADDIAARCVDSEPLRHQARISATPLIVSLRNLGAFGDESVLRRFEQSIFRYTRGYLVGEMT